MLDSEFIFQQIMILPPLKALDRSTGALILYLSYGYEMPEDDTKDPLVNIAEAAMHGFSRASEPGAYLVDTIPWLKYIPDWMPCIRWKQDLKAMRLAREALYDVPFKYVQKEMVHETLLRNIHVISQPFLRKMVLHPIHLFRLT